jgi:hypothetical protein
MANHNGSRIFYISDQTDGMSLSLAGFDLFRDIKFTLGGFTIDVFAGITMPGESGWDTK